MPVSLTQLVCCLVAKSGKQSTCEAKDGDSIPGWGTSPTGYSPKGCKESNVTKHTQLLSLVQLLVTPWTAAHQVPLSRGFPRQEYWSGLPFPSPGDLPNPGIKPKSLALADRFFTTELPGKSLT